MCVAAGGVARVPKSGSPRVRAHVLACVHVHHARAGGVRVRVGAFIRDNPNYPK